jgi:hypothetical protein
LIETFGSGYDALVNPTDVTQYAGDSVLIDNNAAVNCKTDINVPFYLNSELAPWHSDFKMSLRVNLFAGNTRGYNNFPRIMGYGKIGETDLSFRSTTVYEDLYNTGDFVGSGFPQISLMKPGLYQEGAEGNPFWVSYKPFEHQTFSLGLNFLTWNVQVDPNIDVLLYSGVKTSLPYVKTPLLYPRSLPNVVSDLVTDPSVTRSREYDTSNPLPPVYNSQLVPYDRWGISVDPVTIDLYDPANDGLKLIQVLPGVSARLADNFTPDYFGPSQPVNFVDVSLTNGRYLHFIDVSQLIRVL